MLFHEESTDPIINLEVPAASTNPEEPTAPLSALKNLLPPSSTLKNPLPHHQP
jgi:hypothetical protein